jgi:hypothetical protein
MLRIIQAIDLQMAVRLLALRSGHTPHVLKRNSPSCLKCLINEVPSLFMYGEVEVQLDALTTALVGGQWSVVSGQWSG